MAHPLDVPKFGVTFLFWAHVLHVDALVGLFSHMATQVYLVSKESTFLFRQRK
jgi:hypothetical protein